MKKHCTRKLFNGRRRKNQSVFAVSLLRRMSSPLLIAERISGLSWVSDFGFLGSWIMIRNWKCSKMTLAI